MPDSIHVPTSRAPRFIGHAAQPLSARRALHARPGRHQHEPNVKAFYNKLVAAGKKPMQAVVAVMRKLLHVIWGMLKHDQDFDGNKFSDSPKQFLDRKKSI
jgi:hypothetical protein